MKKRILVIEDDLDQAQALQLQLEAEGFEVHLETHGISALNFVSEHPIDLVVLDIKLPDISGFHVCKGLRQIARPWTVPIVMLTGMTEPVDQLRGFAHGADAYLTKPHAISELLKAIRSLLGDVEIGPSWPNAA